MNLFPVKINLYHTPSPNTPLYYRPTLPLHPLGASHIKRTGVLVGNFEKNSQEVPRTCFVGVTILKQHIMSSHIFFWLNTLKGTTKAPAVHLLRLNTFRDTETAFFTPKRFDELPVLFIWESYPGLDLSLLSPNKKCILFPYVFFPKHLSVLYLVQTVCRTKHISFVISTNCLKDMESDKKGQLTPTATLPEK